MAGSAATILVVEDDESICESLRDLLKLEGYETVTAPDLPGARAALATFRIDVILLDLMLGDERGEDFIDELGKQSRPPPVVIISALYDAPTIARTRGVAVVPKPFEIDRLLTVIGNAIERSANSGARS
jgi:DNA-binding response OmpR family regulator